MTQSPAAAALGDLVCAYHVEASRGPDIRGTLICEEAAQLDAVRIQNLRGVMSDEDAFIWLDVGRHQLAKRILERTLTSDPARDMVRHRIRHG